MTHRAMRTECPFRRETFEVAFPVPPCFWWSFRVHRVVTRRHLRDSTNLLCVSIHLLHKFKLILCPNLPVNYCSAGSIGPWRLATWSWVPFPSDCTVAVDCWGGNFGQSTLRSACFSRVHFAELQIPMVSKVEIGFSLNLCLMKKYIIHYLRKQFFLNRF